ncbi:HAD family hydrolase [Enterococcus casseliflavus]|uniref:HAD family hydrolase n=1 Tax=Enterococcus casseliflavus TaxID=37734 RepID=UPI0022E95173|nr:HAD family phosphatase [Enterococcus casseliflavus]
MKKIKLVIFDMDGLMFETGRLAYRAYLRAAEEYDFEVCQEVYYYLTGRTEADIRIGMQELYGNQVPTDQWREAMNRQKEVILAEEKRVFKKPGLLELLEALKKQDCLIAVASSSSKEKIKAYFEMEQMPDWFDTVVSGDQVQKGKPDPEIFLTACQQLGVKPEEALVLEDSLAGIKAAKQAEIPAFLIADDLSALPVKKNGKYPLLKQPKLEQEVAAQVKTFSDLTKVKDWLVVNHFSWD